MSEKGRTRERWNIYASFLMKVGRGLDIEMFLRKSPHIVVTACKSIQK